MGGCISSNSQAVIVCHSSKLQPTPSFYYGKSISIEEIDNLRNEFWCSRVEGSSIMWQALKSASEALLNDDIELARSLLDASELKICNNMLGTCYDTRYYHFYNTKTLNINNYNNFY